MRTHPYAPIGYTTDGQVVCDDCIGDDKDDENTGAISPWDEWHEPYEPMCQTLTCDFCLAELDTYKHDPEDMDSYTKDIAEAAARLAYEVLAQVRPDTRYREELPPTMFADATDSIRGMARKVQDELGYTDLCRNVLDRGRCPVCTV